MHQQLHEGTLTTSKGSLTVDSPDQQARASSSSLWYCRERTISRPMMASTPASSEPCSSTSTSFTACRKLVMSVKDLKIPVNGLYASWCLQLGANYVTTKDDMASVGHQRKGAYSLHHNIIPLQCTYSNDHPLHGGSGTLTTTEHMRTFRCPSANNLTLSMNATAFVCACCAAMDPALAVRAAAVTATGAVTQCSVASRCG